MNWFVLGIIVEWNNLLVKMNGGNYVQNFKLVVKLNLNGSLHTGGFHSKQTNKFLVPIICSDSIYWQWIKFLFLYFIQVRESNLSAKVDKSTYLH